MSFQGKYHIQSALGEGEAPSFHALQVSSGQSVIVHHLVAGKTPPQQPDLAFLIFRFLSRASDEESRKLLDMGEDEGRIYVVTPDVPECRDLRQWLQSVTGASEPEAQPAKQAAGPVNLDSTRAFTTEALRQALRIAESASVPNPPPTEGSSSPEDFGATRGYTTEAMRQALRNVPAPVPPTVATPPAGLLEDTSKSAGAPPRANPPTTESSDALKQFPQIHKASLEDSIGRVTDFTAFWEKASPASHAGDPVPGPPPSGSTKGPEAPSQDTEVTARYIFHPTSQGQTSGKDASKPPAPTPATPSAKGPGTVILGGIKDLSLEGGKVPPTVGAKVPSVGEASGAEGKMAEEAPRPKIPAGFEVVFQSTKPRSRSGSPNKSGIMAAPAPIAPSTEPKELTPAPVATDPSNAVAPVSIPPVASPPARQAGETLAMNFPNISAEPKTEPGVMNAATTPPSPSPSIGAAPLKEKMPVALVIPSPPAPAPKEPVSVAPVAPRPSAPPSLPPPGPSTKEPEHATRFVAVPPPLPDSTLRPTPLNRSQPGEFTRMMQNVKAQAGPLPPVGPLGSTPAAVKPAASPQAPAYSPGPAPYSPPVFIAKDKPLHPARRKRNIWVPILILSSLFLMTVALLVFFAFKR